MNEQERRIPWLSCIGFCADAAAANGGGVACLAGVDVRAFAPATTVQTEQTPLTPAYR